MLRHSVAPIALSIFFVSACGGSEDGPPTVDPVPPASEEDETPEEVLFTLTSTSEGEAQSTTSASKSRSLAAFSENQAWSITARSPNAKGAFISLEFGDNGNGDADHFTYDDDTGELTLVKPVDFERPADANADNSFELQMVAHEYPTAPTINFAIDVLDQKEIFEDFPVVWLNGETQFGGLGRNLAPLGDIDGDGRPDLAVAAPGRHNQDDYETLPPNGYHASGELYVVSGEALSETTFLNFRDASRPGVWHLTGTESDLNLGYNMTLIDDLDGDALSEFLVARDDRTIQVISGATLVDRMQAGGEISFDDLTTGSIRLEGTNARHVLDPRTFAPVGDLDGDGLSELAFCANKYIGGSSVEAHVFILSGVALKDVLLADEARSIGDYFETSQAAYYSYLGNHANCGPLTAIGDVDADDLTDIAIPMPGPQAGDSGILVFGGSQLLNMMEQGGRITVTAIDRFFYNAKEPYVHFSDNAVIGTEQHYMVNALGDVTGDGIDDFSFSWGRYLRSDGSAFVVKGDRQLLTNLGGSKDLRSMISGGGSIQLDASPDGLTANDARVEHIHALLAPDDGLHETLIFVGAGESSGELFDSFILPANDLPDGGTSIVQLPIPGAGQLSLPRANRRQLSYVISVGDLNTDGYGDLAIGWGTSDAGQVEDAGTVLLISGKEIVDADAVGEMFQPTKRVKVPE